MKHQISLFLKKNALILIGALIGTTAGFLYWKFVGCASGHCPITSSPVNSSLYGAIMGGLLFSLGKKKVEKEKTEDSE
jgi:hypothetical protein